MKHSLLLLFASLLAACTAPSPAWDRSSVPPPRAMPEDEQTEFGLAPRLAVEPPVANRRVRPLSGGYAWLHEFEAGGTAWHVIVFDARQNTLRVIDQPDSWAGGGVMDDLLDAAGAVAGVNGGFFTPSFDPLGLMIADGRHIGEWRSNKLLTGALVVFQGTPRLVWNVEGRREAGASDLLQAGPRLMDNGKAMMNLDRVKNAARTFIATNGAHLWALGVLRSASLAELGRLLATRDLIPGFHIQRALNLDGGRSSAIFARLGDGTRINDPGWSAVRNYLAVVPRR